MRVPVLVSLLAGAVFPASAGLLNSSALDPSLFRVTQFTTGLPFPGGMAITPDGGFLVATSPGYSSGAILRFTDQNLDGFADGPGVAVFSGSGGPYTSLVYTGKYWLVAEELANKYVLLQPGANPTDPYTVAGELQVQFQSFPWLHPTEGATVAPVAGNPNQIDVFFNVGSEFNDALSSTNATLSGMGLSPVSIAGDSLYRIRIDQGGASPVVVGGPVQIATGIRNVYGFAYDATNGNLYFADNAIDALVDPWTSPPPQADELNVLTALQLAGGVVNFGYPTCYIQYLTGAAVGSGCQMPLAVFQPVNGNRSEGPAGVALAPPGFPAGFNSGLFVGFYGYDGGPVNDQNALVFYSLGTGQYLHFIESANPLTGAPINLYSSSDSLFVADFLTGDVWQITATGVPEPGNTALVLVAILGFGWFRLLSSSEKRRCRR
ncbi:MAG: hypothetical protein JNK87_29620 [Bryobacterales bacterium]|nr:hypothetical protein [Bryobacterales bacterium]